MMSREISRREGAQNGSPLGFLQGWRQTLRASVPAPRGGPSCGGGSARPQLQRALPHRSAAPFRGAGKTLPNFHLGQERTDAGPEARFSSTKPHDGRSTRRHTGLNYRKRKWTRSRLPGLEDKAPTLTVRSETPSNATQPPPSPAASKRTLRAAPRPPPRVPPPRATPVLGAGPRAASGRRRRLLATFNCVASANGKERGPRFESQRPAARAEAARGRDDLAGGPAQLPGACALGVPRLRNLGARCFRLRGAPAVVAPGPGSTRETGSASGPGRGDPGGDKAEARSTAHFWGKDSWDFLH
ncbi:putative HTLV-1-related endogenous sequence [Elephas maximus indicus]|uniref:putative HTLV-1-related endogenous sequence n=1 Tax=Elephas maximus indicus TaxID=99487 RepID=UPI002116BCBD|nr:putative HTLV-1-related endogenous sequence [Elephas maximus indicus]